MRIKEKLIKLASTSIVTIFLNLIAVLLLARIYSPGEIGVASMALAIISLIGSVSTLKYETSFVGEKDKNLMLSILHGGIFIAVIITIFTFILAGFFPLDHFPYQGENNIDLRIVLSFAVLLTGILGLLFQWNINHNMVSEYAISKLLNSVTINYIPLFAFMIYGNTNPIYIIAGNILGNFATIIYLLVLGNFPRGEIRISATANALKKHSSYLLNMPLILAATIRERGVLIIIGFMGGTEIVGAFTMIQKLINVPVNLISQVMRPLLISESYKGDEHLYKLIKKALKLLLLPIPLGIALIFLYKDFMVGILLGKKWVDYSYLLLIYMPYASVLFLVNWMDRLYDIQYEMRWASAYEVINAFISLIIISVAFNIFNDNLTPIFLYSLALGLFNIFYLWKSIKIVSGSVREIFQHFVFAFLTVCGSLFIITKYISDFKLSWYEIFPLFVLWCVVLIFSAKKIIRSDEITR